MIVAYLRVSTERQHLINQRNEIVKFAQARGLTIDRWEKEIVSGCCRKEKRNLGHLLKSLKTGDSLIVTELSRLSRTLYDIMSVLNSCLERKITVYSTKDGYAFDNSINSKVLAFAFGLVAEIERNLISLRTREALATRRQGGVRLGRPVDYRPKHRLLSEERERIGNMLEQGVSVKAVCLQYGFSRSTFYKYWKENRFYTSGR